MRSPMSIFKEKYVQKVLVRASSHREPLGPLSPRPLQRRDRDQDHREQTGRRRLPDMDIHLPTDDPEPELLRSSRCLVQAFV